MVLYFVELFYHCFMTYTGALDTKRKDHRLWASALTAFIFVQFLFFIDEGYYDLRWMKSAGNWIIFVLYMFFLWGSQLLLMYTLFRKIKRFQLLVSILGLIVGTGIAFFIFSGAWR